ncbi:MAG TPA: hypothetical protein DGG94_16955 [Micromonosporaceae bacterium]|nr:hypothetical protein [Micromonosporaceae bacterium]HCU51461.1 hypothetical protein [Micromonosporaceae bacterium]
MRTELLDRVGAFADQSTAQAAIDGWVHAYNHQRPHQSLKMATPVSVFRPSAAAAPHPSMPVPVPAVGLPPRIPAELVTPSAKTVLSELDITAIEWEAVVPPGGRLNLPSNSGIKLGQAYAGRTVTLWADDRSIHVCLDGHLIRTAAHGCRQGTCLACISKEPGWPAPSLARQRCRHCLRRQRPWSKSTGQSTATGASPWAGITSRCHPTSSASR